MKTKDLNTPVLYPSINELNTLTYGLRSFVNSHSASYGKDAADMLRVLDGWNGQPKMIELSLFNYEVLRFVLTKAIKNAQFEGTKTDFVKLLHKIDSLYKGTW